MADIYEITTTGTQDPVPLADLGLDPIEHPTVSYDLIAEHGFSLDEILVSANSGHLYDAISNGHLTANLNGETINSGNVDEPLEYTEHNHSHTDLNAIGNNSHTAIDSHLSNSAKHREINDSSTSATELWSSQKSNNALNDALNDLDLACIQWRRTTQLNPVPVTPSVADITWDTVDVISDSSVIENNVDNTHIDIKEDGLYQITYLLVADDEVTAKIIKNDSTDIPGSEQHFGEDTDTINAYFSMSVPILVNLSSGDDLKIQVWAQTGSEFLVANALFQVIKLEGLRGEKGDTGAGSNIIVQKDDATIGTVTDTLNFEGTGVSSAVDEGANKTTVTIVPIFGSEFQEISSEAESSTTSSTYQQKLRMTTTNLPAGKYRIGWYFETRQSNDADAVEVQVDLNEGTIIANVEHEPDDARDIWADNGFTHQNISGVNTIDIDWRQQRGSTAYIRRARLELWRVS